MAGKAKNRPLSVHFNPQQPQQLAIANGAGDEAPKVVHLSTIFT
jgi:hypothetical protein